MINGGKLGNPDFTSRPNSGHSIPPLRVRDLRTTFRSRGQLVDAVRGVSFDLLSGEISVLLGESGSGKSVTVRSIMRLYGKSALIHGSAELGGRDLLSADPRDM